MEIDPFLIEQLQREILGGSKYTLYEFCSKLDSFGVFDDKEEVYIKYLSSSVFEEFKNCQEFVDVKSIGILGSPMQTVDINGTTYAAHTALYRIVDDERFILYGKYCFVYSVTKSSSTIDYYIVRMCILNPHK